MKKSDRGRTKSKGTIIAEKGRAKANTFSDDKRSNLVEEGMAIIYGQRAHATAANHRR